MGTRTGFSGWLSGRGQLTEIMICLDETREQKIPVMLCGAELSAGHPEEIVPKLLEYSDCYYSTYPQSQEMYQKYHVTPREQSLEYLFDGLGVYFTRFTDFHPNYLGTDYYDGWNRKRPRMSSSTGIWRPSPCIHSRRWTISATDSTAGTLNPIDHRTAKNLSADVRQGGFSCVYGGRCDSGISLRPAAFRLQPVCSRG